MAFLRTPDTPWLYSGVATSSASAAAIASLNAATEAGSPASSTSWLKRGMSARSRTSFVIPEGADSAAARINPRFNGACRKLPAKPTILIWSIEVLSIVFLPTRAGRAELESPAFGRGSGVG